MSVRSAVRRARRAGTDTIDGEVKRLPAGNAPAPEPKTDERQIPIAPLPAADAGREEARAAFIRDAGGPPLETPPPESASTAEPQKPADQAQQPEVTVDGVTKMAVAMIDGLATMMGPRFVGGSASTWAQTEQESKNLVTTATPLVAKMMSETNITPEALFLGTLAFIYVPRAFAGAMERASEKRSHGPAHETRDARVVGPTGAAPAQAAAVEAPAPPPVAPPPPKPAAPPAAAATTINLAEYLSLK